MGENTGQKLMHKADKLDREEKEGAKDVAECADRSSIKSLLLLVKDDD